MTAPASPNPPPAPRASRPSLMSAGSPARPADGGDDDQGFSVSILSAASTTGEPARGRQRDAGRPRRSAVLWWLGIGGAALALLAVAQWQQRRPVAPTLPLAAVAVSPAVPPAASAAASEAAPVLALAETAASAVPADVPASMPNPFDKFAEPAVAAVAAAPAPSAKPAPVRTAAAPAPKPAAQAVRTATATQPRDRDAELVAALMAHADAGREIMLPPPRPPAPLSTAERNRFAAELRQCQQRHAGNNSARDACRAQACQAKGYAGRTRSCPAVVVADATAGAASRPMP